MPPPPWILDIVVDEEDAVNQLPCSAAARLVTACDCMLVIVTVSVVDVPFVRVFMLFEHEYWLLVSQTFVHAANVGVTSKNITKIPNIASKTFFIN